MCEQEVAEQLKPFFSSSYASIDSVFHGDVKDVAQLVGTQALTCHPFDGFFQQRRFSSLEFPVLLVSPSHSRFAKKHHIIEKYVVLLWRCHRSYSDHKLQGLVQHI